MFTEKTKTEETARSLNVHRHLPSKKMADPPRLAKASTKNKKQNDPRDSERHTQPRKKQFRRAEAEQNGRQQQRSEDADQLIANARHNRAHWANEVLCRMIGR